jgi:3-phenylpropionate/trans-cinnamate dioxygenase ferredoxin reductase subunit
MREQTFVVVGGGVAGLSAVEALRDDGFDGAVHLIGAEDHLPYPRPPLSKGFLSGGGGEALPALRNREWFDDRQVELTLGARVARIDPPDRTLELADGTRLRADKVLLATGGRPRTLERPGGHLPGVQSLRTLDDARAIRDRLVPGAPVVVVGAGFIGAEVAATARTMGCDVTVLETAPQPLGRVLGPEIGRVLADLHREQGVNLRTGIGVDEISGTSRAEHVRASDGTRHPCTVVVVGVGISPDLKLVAGTGIGTGDGIIVDEYCRTSNPAVYAAGDIAFRPDPILGRSIRIEQWQNAQHQGAAAARNMMGKAEPFAEVPWFWSDQYDVKLQMAGLPCPGDRIVSRGDVNSLNFSVFYLRDGAVVGVVGLNRPLDVRIGRRLIGRRTVAPPEVWADESVDLATLG